MLPFSDLSSIDFIKISEGNMAFIQPELYHVVECFPDLKEKIHRNFNESRNFRMLCENYRRCAIAIQGSNESTGDRAQDRKNKYAEMLYDLELEIMCELYDSVY
jgi:hypothetical protein